MKLEIVVSENTKKLYYSKFYEAKKIDNKLTHDEFIRQLMGLR